MVLNWIRSRGAKQAKEPAGQCCIECRSAIAGSTDDELRASGGVFLAGAGWLCGARCERAYRLRFRIQPATTPADGSPHSTASVARRMTPAIDQAALEETEPDRRPAADELAAALRARRRRMNNGT